MMVTMDYDRSKLRRVGRRRRAIRAELEELRQIVIDELPAAREAGLTWRELGEDTSYTDAQLQTLALPPEQREAREQQRRQRRRKQ